MEMTEPRIVPPAGASRARLSVLVVENEPTSRELLARVLRRHDCDADTSIGAEQGHAALLAKPYDLLITDLRMEPVDGVELLTRVAAMPADRRPRALVVLSGYLPKYYDALGKIDLSLELFQKPLHLPSLLSILDRLRGQTATV